MSEIIVPFSPPDIRQQDIDAVCEVLRSGWITTGPITKSFERDIATFCQAKKAVALNSATAGLFLALKLFDIGEGDEVIVTAYTFAATANVILQVGAKPIIVDINESDFCINYEQVARSITSKTKAIISVDYGGKAVDYDKINQIIKSNNLFEAKKNTLQEQLSRILFISDCAHSLGAKYKNENVGHQADISVFSLHAVKNLTTAEGGVATFNDIGCISAENLYNKFMLLALHGMNKDALAKYKNNSWEYDILEIGYKFNMTDTLAAIGASQLTRYQQILDRRAQIADKYKDGLKNTKLICPLQDDEICVGSHHLMPIQIESYDEIARNALIAKLLEVGIATNVHYKPLPMFTLYKKLGYNISDYPNAFNRYKNLITLPIYTTLSDEKIDFVCNKIVDFVK